MRRSSVVQFAVVLALLAPNAANAQTAFPAGEGTIWAQTAVTYSASELRFAGPYRQGDLDYDGGRSVGDRIPISTDEDGGEFRFTAATISLRAGLTPRLSVGAYLVGIQRSVLSLETLEVQRTGVGDLWTEVAYLVTPLEWKLKFAPVVNVKVPLSRADFEVLSVPLSEGQVDIAFGGVATWVFASRANLSVGSRYRVRTPVTSEVGAVELEVDPGDELELHGQVSVAPIPSVWLTAGWRSTLATDARRRVEPFDWEPTEQRRLHALELSAYWTFLSLEQWRSAFALSAFAQFPIAGVDMLAGPVFSGGLAWQFNWKSKNDDGQ